MKTREGPWLASNWVDELHRRAVPAVEQYRNLN